MNGRQLDTITKSNNTFEFKYNVNGMRTQKDDGNYTTYYYYDSNNNLIGLNLVGSTLFFYYDGDGNVTSFSNNNTMYYYVKNLQGDIVKIIDQSGNVKASYTYDAWGKLLSVKDGAGNALSSSDTFNIANLNPFRYRGYVYDNETGLYYLQSRYYDPITGRFLNADVYCDTQTGSPLSTNMFAYCENNAVMKYDATGQDAWWLQSCSSVGYKGHTSLLIQEKAGFWWYFYWGDKSIQLLFLGVTKQVELNDRIKYMLNEYNKKFHLNIKYFENYNATIRFSGNFKNTLNYVRNLMEGYSLNYGARKYLARYDTNYSVNYSGKRSNSIYYYKGKEYMRPYSWIISENKMYNLFAVNCLKISLLALQQGNLSKNANHFKIVIGNIFRAQFVPNRAFDFMAMLGYGRLVYV